MRVLITLVVLFTTSACSLVNPFVFNRDAALTQAKKAQDNPPLPLGGALEYAATAKKSYRRALTDQAKLQNWLAIGLIPLSAAAIGLGARGASPDAVLALGLGGATAYGTGTWLLNRPRQAAYVAGIKAITCAEEVVAPFNLSPTGQADFDKALGGLEMSLKPLRIEIARLQSSLEQAKALQLRLSAKGDAGRSLADRLAPLVAVAEAEIETARTLRDTAESTLSQGRRLQIRMATAGRDLVVAVDRITDEVDGIVVETQKDPQALSAIISNLGTLYQGLTAVPEALAPKKDKEEEARAKQDAVIQSHRSLAQPPAAPETQDEQDLRLATADLIQRLASLRVEEGAVSAARLQVADVVNTVADGVPAEKLKTCGVKASDFANNLTIDPAPPFAIVKPGTIAFTAKGGVSPYSASLAGSPTGIAVSQAAPFSPTVAVTASAEAKDGDYVVIVTDGTGKTARATVAVSSKKGDANGDTRGDAGTPARGLDEVKQELDKLKNQDIKVDGGLTIQIKENALGASFVETTVDVVSVDKDANLEKGPQRVQDAILKKLKAGVDAKAVRIKNHPDLAPERLKAKQPSSGAAPQSAVVCAEPELQGSVARDPVFDALPDADRRMVQRAVGLRGNAVDGRWGRITKGRLMLYQCQSGMTATGVLSPELVQRLRGVQP